MHYLYRVSYVLLFIYDLSFIFWYSFVIDCHRLFACLLARLPFRLYMLRVQSLESFPVVSTTTIDPKANQKILLPKGYLVYSNQCRIVDLDPYKRDVMRHFKRVSYKPCKQRLPLTQMRFDDHSRRYVLSVNKTAFPSYHVENVFSCCYMGVERVSESNVSYTSCQHFKSKAQISNTTDSVIVKCSTDKGQIYINGHATIPERVEIQERLKQWKRRDQGKRVPSVLMIGIDSISRVNLIRAMPKTAQYLYDNDWFELAGYNKVRRI